MNWIIRNTSKLGYHTNLDVLLKPILEDIFDCKWIVSDLEFISSKVLPIDHEHDWFVISSEEMYEIRSADIAT